MNTESLKNRFSNIVFVSGDRDFLQADKNDRRYVINPKIRRPKVVALISEIKNKNPTWSQQKCLAVAKAIITDGR